MVVTVRKLSSNIKYIDLDSEADEETEVQFYEKAALGQAALALFGSKTKIVELKTFKLRRSE